MSCTGQAWPSVAKLATRHLVFSFRKGGVARRLITPIMRWVQTVAKADERSVALFRVGIAFSLLLELAGSWPDRCEFYSDEGLLPWPADRSDLTAILVLHRGSTCAWTTALFILHGLSAAMLLLGVWPRCSAAVAYALQLSLLHRNSYVQTGDSNLLCACLLWAALLPTGERWSIAKRWPSGKPTSTTSTTKAPGCVAAAGLKLQIALFYLTTAIIKMREGRCASRRANSEARCDRPRPRSRPPFAAHARRVAAYARVRSLLAQAPEPHPWVGRRARPFPVARGHRAG